MQKLQQILAFAMTIVLLSACTDAVDGDLNEEKPEEVTDELKLTQNIVENGSITFKATDYTGALTDKEKEIAKAANKFAFEFYKTVVAQQANDNSILSPISAQIALSMLCNGAAGNTAKEIRTALSFGDYTMDDINAYYRKQMNQLQRKEESGCSVEFANAIWADNDIPFYSKFFQTNEKYYDATLANVDFLDIRAYKMMNAWCNEKTHGTIPGFIAEEVQPLLQFVLANVTYFKGKWESPFKDAVTGTKEENFTCLNGQIVKTNMMHTTGYYNYESTDDYSLLEMPYQPGSHSMIVCLPAEGKSLSACIEQIKEKATGQIGKSTYIDLSFPKFKTEVSMDLTEPLYAMGIKDVFNYETSDLSAISPVRNFVMGIIQKAYIATDEKGTEASAITAILGGSDAGNGNYTPPTPIVVKVNRPFFYLIRDNTTGTILFMGKVVKP